jgi:hypothetical protein
MTTRETYQDIVEWAESSRAKEIDDKIEEWHNSDSKQSLAEYLGMTPEQYAAYVEGRVVKSST